MSNASSPPVTARSAALYSTLPAEPGGLKWPAVMYLVLGLAYVLGGALLGTGLYLIRRSTFPGWWRERMLWPLVRVTPTVTHLQGWAAVGLGTSILAIGFTPIVPDIVGGVLVLLAMAAYLVAVLLFIYSTWLSRRTAS